MALFLWDCLFCLLPSLLLLVLLLGVRCPLVSSWMGHIFRTISWCLWMCLCLILHLPLDRKTSPGTSLPSSNGTRFMCKPSTLAKYLLRHCGSLTKATLAPWPKGEPHLQTILGLLSGPPADGLHYTREHLLLKDGGIIALDWAVGTGLSEPNVRRRHEGSSTSTPPVLLLVPQYWGGLSAHLKSLCLTATRQGFYVVVCHHRGTAGCPLTTTRLTEFGDPADLEQMVAYIHSLYPSSALVAVSEGSGSGTLLSYLGEKGSSSYLTAAAALSPVLLGQVWFETDMPPLYHWGALYHRKQQLRRYASSFRRVLDVDYVLRSVSLREFEERLFSHHLQLEATWGLPASMAWALEDRAHPVKDWDSYWERNEPLRDADEVAVPVLCICSQDDPLLPPKATLPLNLFHSNPYFMLLVTETGGHCGFAFETGKDHKIHSNWSHVAVLEYIRAVLDFLKGGEKDLGLWTGPTATMGDQRNRRSTPSTVRRKRGAVIRRPQAQTNSLSERVEQFTWKRSYTR